MKFKAKVMKVGKFYAIEIPAFDLHTQAESKDKINLMIRDLLETVFDQKLDVTIDKPKKTGKHEVRSFHIDPISKIFSVILRQQRMRSGMTVEQVANALGSKSKNAYAAYEQGKREPSISKFVKLLSLVSKEDDVELAIGE